MKDDVQIVFHCSKCGKRIATFRDEDNDLDGMFLGVSSQFSEMLNKFVSVEVICLDCFYRI